MFNAKLALQHPAQNVTSITICIMGNVCIYVLKEQDKIQMEYVVYANKVV